MPKKKYSITDLAKKIFKNHFVSSINEAKIDTKELLASKEKLPVRSSRDSYDIQIGFDFGTSASKCIIRDIAFNRAQVYAPPVVHNPKLPFLLPTTLRLDGSKLMRAPHDGNYYGCDYLPFVKMALTSVAKEDETVDCLQPYIRNLPDEVQLKEFVTAVAVFYLAKNFGEIDDFVRSKFEGFGDINEDQQLINVAIPTFQESNENIENTFRIAINIAWKLRIELKKIEYIDIYQLIEMVEKHDGERYRSLEDGAPYLYPEISAALQVYAKSRSFPEGIYLFSDVGAGTVDQAIFTYHKNGFSFLNANVSPLGSSQIEVLAEKRSPKDIESLRLLKENGDEDNDINLAKSKIFDELKKITLKLVATTVKYKLYRKKQIEKVAILFSGGGSCEYPYERAVRWVFEDSNYFKKKIRLNRYGMPNIHDLTFDWNVDKDQWITRLYVAYGLSFQDVELDKVKLPNQISNTR